MSKLNILTIGQSNIAGFSDFTDLGNLNNNYAFLKNTKWDNVLHGIFEGFKLVDEIFNTDINNFKNKKQYMTYYKPTTQRNTWLPMLGYFLLKNHSAKADLIPNIPTHINKIVFYNAGVGSTSLKDWLKDTPINKITHNGEAITKYVDGYDLHLSPFKRVEYLNNGLKNRGEKFNSIIIEIGETDNVLNTSSYDVYSELKTLISRIRNLSQVDNNTPIYIVFGSYVSGDIDYNVLNGLYSAVKNLPYVYMGDIPDFYLKGDNFRRSDNVHFDLAGGLYHAYNLANRMSLHQEY